VARTKEDTISLEQLERSIKLKQFSPIYLFFGEEDFLLEEIVGLIIKEAIDEASKSFNLDVLYGGDLDAKDVVSTATSFPMMGDRRVVIVREFESLLNKDLLLPILEKPPQTTCLVLITDKPDYRQKVYKTIKEKGTVAEFKRLYDSEIPGWISKRITNLGKKITPDACQHMQAYIGRSLHEVQNEIDKLLIYVGDKKTIDVEDVSNIVGASKLYNIFELQKAIGQKNIKSALEILERMLDAGEYPVGIISMLTKYFQKIWLLQELRMKTKREAELISGLGIRPFTFREFNEAASKYTSAEIENCFAILLETDKSLKSTMTDAKLLMTVLLVKMIKGDGITVNV
jgi:DNA polymerase III subunit delta